MFSKKLKHWNLEIIGYWVFGAGSYIEKDLELSPCPPNCSKDFRKVFVLVYIYELAKFGDLISCGLKDIFKDAPCLMY